MVLFFIVKCFIIMLVLMLYVDVFYDGNIIVICFIKIFCVIKILDYIILFLELLLYIL